MNNHKQKVLGNYLIILLGSIGIILNLFDVINGIQTDHYVYHSTKFGVDAIGEFALLFMIVNIVVGGCLVLLGILGLKRLKNA